jgi:predicted nucleic acid-binding protein
MSYLLDTNVVSEWRKASPDEGVVGWFGTIRADVMFLSVVTLGEIRRGIRLLQLRGDHHQAARYESWLLDLRVLFADRLIPIGVEEMEEWGHGDARQPVSMADGLVAATARVRGWAVVTRNVKDFEGTGVRVLNPFTGAT